MTGPSTKPVLASGGINLFRLEMSQLVGQTLKLFTRQFPGTLITARVISAAENEILVSNIGERDLLSNLVNFQKIIVQFPYKGQEISINAKLKRTGGGRICLVFDDRAVPLSQRKFRRIDQICSVRLATMPSSANLRLKLNSLRWIQTNSANFSSGGLLLNLPGFLERDVRLLLNVNVIDELFPPLVIGQVRYCYQDPEANHQAGVEFIVREVVQRVFPKATLMQLPPVIMQYSVKNREKLNKKILSGTPLKQLAP